MSLTTLLGQSDVKKWMRDRFPFKATKTTKPLSAPPVTKKYALVGTAFDYILRWRLERDKPYRVRTGRWVAERGLFHVGDLCMTVGQDGPDMCLEPHLEEILYGTPGLLEQVEKYRPLYDKYHTLLQNTKRRHADYLKHAAEVDTLLESALTMAALDFVYRSGQVDLLFRFKPDPADTFDLQRLHDVMSLDLPDGMIDLNPEFGEWSRNVGGADADIMCGNTIIDIKTTKFGSFKREYYDQLVGYMLLNMLNGGPDIEWLAVYFSRHGEMVRAPAPHVGADTLDGFRKIIAKHSGSARRVQSELSLLLPGRPFKI